MVQRGNKIEDLNALPLLISTLELHCAVMVLLDVCHSQLFHSLREPSASVRFSISSFSESRRHICQWFRHPSS